MFDFYATDDPHADPDAVPVPRRDVHVHARDGRRAGDLPRRLVDDRAARTAAASAASAPAQFAAYYIVWTLVRTMNIVFTPFGWEWRIREGQLSAQLLRPLHPIHYDLAWFAGQKVLWLVMYLPIGVGLSLVFHPTLHPRRARGRRLPRRDLGRVPHPLDEPLHPRDVHDLDDARRRDLRGLVPVASCCSPAGSLPLTLMPHWAQTLAGLAAVQVDVLLPDRGARREHVDARAARRARRCSCSGRRSARSSSPSSGGSRCGTTRRSATDARAPARRDSTSASAR